MVDHESPNLRVLVSGASGLIGTALTAQLRSAGHTVLTLVRREPVGESESRWDPNAGEIDAGFVASADAVVNLSGASLSRLPWTAGYRHTILQSRLNATHLLAEAMREATNGPRVLVSGSAVGFYGNRPGETLTEQKPVGTGFLAHVVADWEAAAQTAGDGVRVVTVRTGLVIASGGALAPIMLLTRVGLGGRMGTGRQHWPWISLHDEAAAIVHLLTSELSGPVNLVGPQPATASQVTRRVAANLNRPHLLTVPRPAISLLLGEAGRDLLLADQSVSSELLVADGFRFRHTAVEDAVDAVVPRR